MKRRETTLMSVSERPSRALALEADKEGLQAPDKAGTPKSVYGKKGNRRSWKGAADGGSWGSQQSRMERVQQGQTGAGGGPIYGTWAVGWRRDVCGAGCGGRFGRGPGQGSDEGQQQLCVRWAALGREGTFGESNDRYLASHSVSTEIRARQARAGGQRRGRQEGYLLWAR